MPHPRALAAARVRAIEEQEIAERKEGIFYHSRNQASIEAGHRFVGRSADGSSLFSLTADQRERPSRRFAGLIRESGYAKGKPPGGEAPGGAKIPLFSATNLGRSEFPGA